MVLRYRANPRAWISGVLWLLGAAAFAQVGIGVAPPRFELVLPPGASTTESVVVFSRNTPDQRIDVAQVDWLNGVDGALRVLPPGTAPYSAADWLQTSVDPFTLERDGAHAVRFTVTVPEAALEGSYWTGLAFTTEPRPVEREGLTALMRTRAVAVVYVTIQGTERPAAEITGVEVQEVPEKGRFVVVDVVNRGNVYLRLNGELRFVGATGEVVWRGPLPERVLLRDGVTRYTLPVPEGLPDDVVLAAVEIVPKGPAGSYGGPTLYGEVSWP